MKTFIRRAMLVLGPVGTDVLAVLASSAAVNLLTADDPKVVPGVAMLIGGVLLFVAARALAEVFSAARSYHDRRIQENFGDVLTQQFDQSLGRTFKPFLFALGLSACCVGLAIHIRTQALTTAPVPKSAGATSSTGAKKHVTIATSKNLWCALTLIALDQGYFSAEGLEIEPTFQLAGRQNMDALVSSTVDIANVVEVNNAYQALNGNVDLGIIGSIVAARDFAVISKKSSGISKPSDLVGKTLTFAPGTGAEMYVFALLKANNIDPRKVKLKRVQPAGLVDSIASPEVDAAASWEPFVSAMTTRLGTQAARLQVGDPYVGVMNIATRKSWLSQNRDVVIKFLRAIDRAADLVRQHPEEARQVVAKATGLDASLVAASWGRFEFSLSLDPAAQAKLLGFVVDTITANDSQYSGRTTPNTTSYFIPNLLEEARRR